MMRINPQLGQSIAKLRLVISGLLEIPMDFHSSHSRQNTKMIDWYYTTSLVSNSHL